MRGFHREELGAFDSRSKQLACVNQCHPVPGHRFLYRCPSSQFLSFVPVSLSSLAASSLDLAILLPLFPICCRSRSACSLSSPPFSFLNSPLSLPPSLTTPALSLDLHCLIRVRPKQWTYCCTSGRGPGAVGTLCFLVCVFGRRDMVEAHQRAEGEGRRVCLQITGGRTHGEVELRSVPAAHY